jgi:integrase
MARKKLEPGERGQIKYTRQVKGPDGEWRKAEPGIKNGGRVEAVVIWCDAYGKQHKTYGHGSSQANAECDLGERLERLMGERKGSLLTSTSRVSEALKLWDQALDRADYSPRSGALAPQTKKHYRSAARCHLEGSTLTPLTLEAANSVGTLRSFLQGVADESGQGAMETVRKVLGWVFQLALEDGAIQHRALDNVRKIASTKPKAPGVARLDRNRTLTEEECQAFQEFFDTSERAAELDLADLIAFGLSTGARISEALAVRWTDVNFEKQEVLITRTKVKGTTGTVPMSPGLQERLKKRADARGTQGLVFPATKTSKANPNLDQPRDSHNIRKQLRPLFKAAGFDWLCFHSLRHTAATQLAVNGGAVAQIAALLGHNNLRSLDRYVEVARAGAAIDPTQLI